MKVKLDARAIQEFLLEHVEKIIFAGVALCFVVFVAQSLTRDRYRRTPKELADAAARAIQAIESARPEDNPLVKQCRFKDFKKLAEESRAPVEDKLYAHVVPWKPPLFPSPEPRVKPPFFSVEELRGVAGRGPFLINTAGVRAADASRVRGYRYIVVTGAIPLQKQLEAYRRAFEGNPRQTDVPKYAYFYIQRADVTGLAPGQEPQWEETKLADVVKMISKEMGPPKADPMESSFFNEKFMDKAMILGLPPLSGREWDPQVVYHPRVIGPSYEQVYANAEAHRGQKVWWPGELVDSQGNVAVYLYKGIGTTGEANYFAVEHRTPVPEKAQGTRATTVVTGFVAGSTRLNVAGGGGRAARSRTMPLLRLEADQTRPEAPLPEVEDPLKQKTSPEKPAPEPAVVVDRDKDIPRYLLLRFFDFDVQPGRQYRYRVQLLLHNPNFGVPPALLEDERHAREQYVRSDQPDWSEPTEPILVPTDSRIIAGRVLPPNRPAIDPLPQQGWIKVEQWWPPNGRDASEKFLCWRGTALDFPGRVYPPAREAPTTPAKSSTSKTGQHGDLLGTSSAASKTARDGLEFTVDYKTGALLLDMRGGDRLSNKYRELTSPGEYLVLQADGTLKVYSEIEDITEFEKGEEAEPVEPGMGPGETPEDPYKVPPHGKGKTKPKGFEGGLEFDTFK